MPKVNPNSHGHSFFFRTLTLSGVDVLTFADQDREECQGVLIHGAQWCILFSGRKSPVVKVGSWKQCFQVIREKPLVAVINQDGDW